MVNKEMKQEEPVPGRGLVLYHIKGFHPNYI
jgi:hypothetical protein